MSDRTGRWSADQRSTPSTTYARRDPSPQPQPQRMTLVEPQSLGLPGKPMVDTELIQDALNKATEWGNVLMPVTYIDRLPPMHEVSLRVAFFDPGGTWDNRSNGIWYELKGGKLGLGKAALLSVWRMAGGEWWPPGCYREDDGSTELYWRYRASGVLKGWTGQMGKWTCARERDLRDGSAATAGMSDAQKGMVRQFGGETCETMAMLRVVRAALGFRGGYTKAEAARPFILPVLQFAPDLSNPRIAEMVTAAQLGALGAVYGRGRQIVEAAVSPADYAAELRSSKGEPLPSWREAGHDEADEEAAGPPAPAEPHCVECGAAVSTELESWCACNLADGATRCRQHATSAPRKRAAPAASNAGNSTPARSSATDRRGGGR